MFNRRKVRLSDIGEHLDASAEAGSDAASHAAVFQQQPLQLVEFSVSVFASVVVIAAGEFDEHARLIAHGPRIVTRWQQHHIVH